MLSRKKCIFRGALKVPPSSDAAVSGGKTGNTSVTLAAPPGLILRRITWIDHTCFSAFMAAIPDEVVVVMDGAYTEYASYRLAAAYPDVFQAPEAISEFGECPHF